MGIIGCIRWLLVLWIPRLMTTGSDSCKGLEKL
jgi:hypothetical protein